jgi:hypothetical protein
MSQIDWLPITDIPSEFRDSRQVLFWTEAGAIVA